MILLANEKDASGDTVAWEKDGEGDNLKDNDEYLLICHCTTSTTCHPI